jgi:cytochrome c oxidase assembly protein subunit 11
MSVRFDANVDPNMPWQFRPRQTTQTVAIGARTLAIFEAHNKSDQVITGAASFNVAPMKRRAISQGRLFLFHPTDAATGAKRAHAGDLLRRSQDPGRQGCEGRAQITLSYTFHRR